MNELALFAGAGGGILGGHLLGWRTVCAVEWEPYPASVLAQRQNDGILPAFPIWDDVCTFDGLPWRGIVDVVSGGFPCQDISAAGKGAGISGERSGMWAEMARIIGEVRPRFAFVENSPMLTLRGLGTVLGDLAEMGFDARWGVLGASAVGAHHKRERIWIVAYSTGERSERWREEGIRTDGDCRRSAGQRGRKIAEIAGHGETMADTNCERAHRAGTCRTGRDELESYGFPVSDADRQQHQSAPHARRGQREGAGSSIIWGDWATEPDVGRVANGVAARVDRLKAIGNGQVPQCAAEAWRILTHNVY
jgi:DNA (cytosine-5)-methyltransferase 1